MDSLNLKAVAVSSTSTGYVLPACLTTTDSAIAFTLLRVRDPSISTLVDPSISTLVILAMMYKRTSKNSEIEPGRTAITACFLTWININFRRDG